MHAKARHILFDLDGTLVDTAPDLAFALNRTLTRHGREPLPFAAIRPKVSLGGAALVRLGFGMDETDPDFRPISHEFLATYRDNVVRQSRLFPGMEQVLNRLDDINVRWGIVTNKPAWLTRPLLRSLQLDIRAHCIVSGDTLEQRKPHPAPLLHACTLLQCRPQETLYAGDARSDIEAGLSAGMITLVAAYGYLDTDEEPHSWGADGLIDSAPAILPWLIPDNDK